MSPLNMGLARGMVINTRPLSSSPATDPNFSSVSLLLHMNGANGSLIFTDSSSNGLTATRVGQAQISTAQSVFGGASGLFDGNGDYLEYPYNSKLDLLGSNFTVEAFIRTNSNKASGMRIASAGGGAVGWNSTNGIHWLFQLASNGQLQFQWWNGSTVDGLQSSAIVPLATWTHVAISISGSTGYFGIGGTVASSATNNITRPSSNPILTVGTINGESGGSSTAFDGHIDEFRITKGVARWTSNYTVPTSAFPDS